MPPRQIHLVVFDLGRVMVRLCNGWRHACERAGVPYRPGYDSPEIREPMLRLTYLSEVGKLSNDGWAEEAAKLTGLTPQQVDSISRVWLDGPFPGWDALLDRLAAAHVRTACLSNTNAVHWQQMHEDGGPHRLPMERLTFRFASHLIGAHKPEPEIYRHVERTTGIPPRAILLFDDLEANILGARDRGWAGVVIDTKRDPVTQVEEALKGYGVG